MSMDEKLRQELLDLINKAQADMNAGNLNNANASMDAAKDKIKNPLPGTGSNGEIHK